MASPKYNGQLLVALSKRGIFAAPSENYNDFLSRAAKVLPHTQEIQMDTVQKIYDINPDWVNLIYSNDSLHFWEGGCTWEKEGAIVMQLRKAFGKKNRLYGLYKKEELISHELVHAVRVPLQSSVFEEFFAYQTSANRLRRYFGPLIRYPKESLFFVSCWLLFFLVTPWPKIQMIVSLLNMALVFFAVARLVRTWRVFARAKRKIGLFLKKEENVLPFMIHLTDEEVMRFAKMNTDEIRGYITKGSKCDVRLSQVAARFL